MLPIASLFKVQKQDCVFAFLCLSVRLTAGYLKVS